MPTRHLDKEQLCPIERQFLEGIVHDYHRIYGRTYRLGWLLSRKLAERVYNRRRDPNVEARAVFYAIHKAFSGRAQREVEVYSSFVDALSSCAAIAMGYDLNQVIPWDRARHDKMILRALAGFMQILQRAIADHAAEARQSLDQVGNLEVWSGGKVMYGDFEVPSWYVLHVESSHKNVRRLA